MQILLQVAATIFPLGLLCYHLWFKQTWWRNCVIKRRQGNKDTIIIYPDIMSWLRLSKPISIPAYSLSKVLVTKHCLLFFTGPYKIAEVWMLKWQIDGIAAELESRCPHASIEYQPFFPAEHVEKVEHSYFGLRFNTFSGGKYHEVLDTQDDIFDLFFQLPENDPHTLLPHIPESEQEAPATDGEEK